MNSQKQSKKVILNIILLGGGVSHDYEISIGIVNCEIKGCNKENVLGVNFEYSWMSWEICFECLDKTKKQFQDQL